ncbi:hypothetical protein ACH4CE_33790 [Streptomyces gelaticus]|uniref:hypothetical protein n=1 Tax=Streptomyces gelaticus TaxID=285446 RepID=UPI0037945143
MEQDLVSGTFSRPTSHDDVGELLDGGAQCRVGQMFVGECGVEAVVKFHPDHGQRVFALRG